MPETAVARVASTMSAMSEPWIVLKSELLGGEHIVFCTAPEHYAACRRAHPDKAIYFAPEVRRVAGWDPERIRMANAVKRVQLRYLDSNQNWNEQWPPFSTQPIAAAGQRSRPLAVEVTIELEDMGTITRLIEVGG